MGLVLVVLLSCYIQSGNYFATSPDCEDRVKQILKGLPSNSLRSELERGQRGDCVHQMWMDKMRKYGVKEASFLIEYSWKNENARFKVEQVTYLKDYAEDARGAIKDAGTLRKIVGSGLEKELRDAVLGKVRQSAFAKRPAYQTGRDKFGVSLFDDEALPAIFVVF